MRTVVALLVLLMIAPGEGFAGEPSAGMGAGKAPVRMEDLEVHGSAPLLMDELEVRGLREMSGELYLPVHREVVVPSPVRYDLFLEDMERPEAYREILSGETPSDNPFAPKSSP